MFMTLLAQSKSWLFPHFFSFQKSRWRLKKKNPSLLTTSSRTITNLNIPVGKTTRLSLIRSKWKGKKVDTTAARDHTRRIEATATMNTGRRKGRLDITGEGLAFWLF